MREYSVTVAFQGLYENDFELEAALPEILDQVNRKVPRILARKPGCVCTAPEIDDMIKDLNGNTIGSIVIDIP